MAASGRYRSRFCIFFLPSASQHIAVVLMELGEQPETFRQKQCLLLPAIGLELPFAFVMR